MLEKDDFLCQCKLHRQQHGDQVSDLWKNWQFVWEITHQHSAITHSEDDNEQCKSTHRLQFLPNFSLFPPANSDPSASYPHHVLVKRLRSASSEAHEVSQQTASFYTPALAALQGSVTPSKGRAGCTLLHNNWLVSLWLTGIMEYAYPPTQRAQPILFSWLLASDDCNIQGKHFSVVSLRNHLWDALQIKY